MGFLFLLSFRGCEVGALCQEVVFGPTNEEAHGTHEGPVDFCREIIYFKG